MTRPSRATAAGRAFLDLQRLGRDSGRPVQELLQLYVLEGFLDRLQRSPDADRLVLKGGVLLAAFGERRPTRDIDLQAQAMSNETDDVQRHIIDIAKISIDDGIEFDTVAATAAAIRDEDAYTGVRISMPAALATARLAFHVDVNVGDPIVPPAGYIDLPRLLGGTITIKGYPLEMVLAEKIITALARGTVNTRWRDFVDVVILTRRHAVDAPRLAQSLQRVAEHREVAIRPLAAVLAGYGEIGQTRWAAWRRKQLLDDRTPAEFADLVGEFVGFADPILQLDNGLERWDPIKRRWN